MNHFARNLTFATALFTSGCPFAPRCWETATCPIVDSGVDSGSDAAISASTPSPSSANSLEASVTATTSPPTSDAAEAGSEEIELDSAVDDADVSDTQGQDGAVVADAAVEPPDASIVEFGDGAVETSVSPCAEPGFVVCEETCIDPNTNDDFCGATEGCEPAGERCATGEVCAGGACREWGAPSSILTNSTNGVSSASIAVTDTGNALALWVENGQPDLNARLYDAESKSWGPKTQVNENASNPSPFEVFPEGPSSFVVVWYTYVDRTIQSRRWSGSAWEEILTVGDNLEISPPMVATDGHSRGIVTWVDYDTSIEEWVVRARLWNPPTHSWGPLETVHATETALADVTTAIRPDGQAYMVWHGTPDVTPGDWEVWGSHYDPSNGRWSAAQTFGSAPSRQSGFELAVTDAGSLLAYWAARMKGVFWRSPPGDWVTTTSEGTSMEATLCSLGGEDAMLVGRTSGVDIWAQRWNGSNETLAPAISLGSDGAFLVRCSAGVALAAGSDWTRRWSETQQQWGASHTFAPGFTYDAAVSSNGNVFVVRGADEIDYWYRGLAVEIFD